MQNLTDLSIRTLSEGYHWDGKIPSFGIRIGKKRKTWVVVKGPNRTKVTIGHYPALSLSDARKRAQAALLAPHEAKSAPTFPDALEAFLGQDRWKPRSKVVLASSLKHFDWKRPLDKITHEDVAQALEKIEGKSARAHALKDIRTFFNWCVPRYLSTSPTQGMKMPAYKPRERVLTDDELKRVWKAAEDMGTFGAIIRLLILTGQRRGEIAALKWKWIHEDRITLPKELTKNHREHSFPMASLSKSILAFRMTLTTQSPFIFPATNSTSSQKPYNGWGKHHKQLLEKSDTSDWTIHDLRRTFATGLASLGVAIHVTEKILNHVSGSTGGIVGVYNKHAYWNEQVEALQKWEEKLATLVREKA